MDSGKRIRTLENDLKAEKRLHQLYSESIFTKDTGWWKNDITGLKKEFPEL